MNDQATISIMLNRGLEPEELEKVQRLDGPIAATLQQAGYVVRVCQGRSDGAGVRWLDFCGDLVGQNIIASIPMDEFLEASDGEVVRLVAASCS